MKARLWRYAGPIQRAYRARVVLVARKLRGIGFPADPTSTEMSMPQGPALMPPHPSRALVPSSCRSSPRENSGERIRAVSASAPELRRRASDNEIS